MLVAGMGEYKLGAVNRVWTVYKTYIIRSIRPHLPNRSNSFRKSCNITRRTFTRNSTKYLIPAAVSLRTQYRSLSSCDSKSNTPHPLPNYSDWTLTQQHIRKSINEICSSFPEDPYWLNADSTATFPHEFFRSLASAGWLGICMPKSYDGMNYGISEAAVMMQTISESGAGMSGASAVHMNIFGLEPVVKYGTKAQKERLLVPLIRGREKACFAVTEPNTGLDTLKLQSFAEKSQHQDRKGSGYVLRGSKIWTSTAQIAEKVLILVRTTPLEHVEKASHGLSLFYTNLDPIKVQVSAIHKMGRAAVDSNILLFEDWFVPDEDLIGEEGNGFKMIMHGMNAERILIAAEALGLGYAALRRTTDIVRHGCGDDAIPIGRNQGIQHPLADSWMKLEAARLMVYRAAQMYDDGKEKSLEDHDRRKIGEHANAAKYLAAEAAYECCERAIIILGETRLDATQHVERYFRESLIPRIAPVSREMILNFIAERTLNLPKSY